MVNPRCNKLRKVTFFIPPSSFHIVYKNEDSTIELDFLIRVKNEIVPIEVKAKRGKAVLLNKILENKILNFGIKLSMNNIGFEKNIFTFPYFLTFLLKRFFKENEIIQW